MFSIEIESIQEMIWKVIQILSTSKYKKNGENGEISQGYILMPKMGKLQIIVIIFCYILSNLHIIAQCYTVIYSE